MSIATPSEITEARANSSKRYAASSSFPCFFALRLKKLKAKSRFCIDILRFYHINKLSIKNMLNLFI